MLTRRSFLRGAGASLALPFLPSMLPKAARAQGQRPTRFFAFYVPNGIHMAGWTPPSLGAEWEMTPILEPLAPFRDQLLVLSGLRNDPARPDGPGDHAAGTGSFLTAAHCFKTEGANIRNGVSIDQVIANEVGGRHRFSSLVLGAEGGGNAGGCDSGYSCAYSRNISWVDEARPAAKEINPVSLFNRLFGGADAVDPVVLAKKRLYQRSLLDFVAEDARRLDARLGAKDRQKLDQYLTSVRAVEQQIELAEAQQCAHQGEPGRPDDFIERGQALMDLSVLAMQCDLTPVVTFMLANAGSNRAYPFLGIPEGHHQLSHHQGNPDNHAKLQTIDIWEMQQLAYLLERMAAVDEGDGTLLDNSVVFFSSEIEDGNSHRHSNLPVLLAGGARGQLVPGRHLRFDNAPIADLFISLARLTGVQLETFGDDGTGPLNLA